MINLKLNVNTLYREINWNSNIYCFVLFAPLQGATNEHGIRKI